MAKAMYQIALKKQIPRTSEKESIQQALEKLD
jgi:hypothetical protein